MPRTDIPVQTIAAFGAEIDSITWTAADAANDHEFKNNGRVFLLARNNDASVHTATIISVPNASTFNRSGDQSMVTPAAAGGLQGSSIGGPYPPTGFNQADGVVHVDLTTDTTLWYAAVEYTPSPHA